MKFDFRRSMKELIFTAARNKAGYYEDLNLSNKWEDIAKEVHVRVVANLYKYRNYRGNDKILDLIRFNFELVEAKYIKLNNLMKTEYGI